MPGATNFEEIVLDSLSVGEAVSQDLAAGEDLDFRSGVWWLRLSVPFYQPAYFFQPLEPGRCRPHLGKALIGYHHVVPDGRMANSSYTVMVHPDVKTYSFDALPAKERNTVRKAMKHLTARKVTDVNDLLTSGYEAYVSFRKRTGFGRDKTDRRRFAGWIEKAFAIEKRFYLGIYHESRLVAFMHPSAVEGVAGIRVLISHSDYLQYCPNDLLFHAFLTICRNSPAVTSAEAGAASLKSSLDSFKMKWGFQPTRYPTYTWISPLARLPLRLFARRRYLHLMGRDRVEQMG